MPEGPEVRYITDTLRTNFQSKTLTNLEILSGRYKKRPPTNYNKLIKHLPTKITTIQNKGKFMYMILENGFTLWITLGLTGTFVLDCATKTRDERGILVDNFCHIKYTTSSKPFFYSDMRNFGTLHIHPPTTNNNSLQKKLNTLGPDPLEVSSPSEKRKQIDTYVKSLESRKNQMTPIGTLLLEQKYLAGVGNYIRAIALYKAKISPHRPLKSLSTTDLQNIYDAVYKVEHASYNKQKLEGLHTFKLEIYRKDKDSLGNPVRKDELPKGRHIYWVEKIQK